MTDVDQVAKMQVKRNWAGLWFSRWMFDQTGPSAPLGPFIVRASAISALRKSANNDDGLGWEDVDD